MELMTISEVAKELGVKLTTAYRYLDCGIIPSPTSKKKVGRVWVRTWDKSDILSCKVAVAAKQARNGVRGKDKKKRSSRSDINAFDMRKFTNAEALMNAIVRSTR